MSIPMEKNLPSLARKVINRFYPPAHFAFYLQRTVLHPSCRRKIAQWLADRLPKSVHFACTERQLCIVKELRESGFTPVPGLISEEQIGDIVRFLDGKQCYDRWRSSNGHFRISEAPPECHVAPYKEKDVLQCPHLLGIANHQDILASVEKLFGCKPTLSQLSLWWSLPGHAGPEDAELFHRDVDEWQFIKLFVYLTDVDAGSGPHAFVKGSSAIPKLLPIKRYQDSEVEREFGPENIIRFTGRAGTAFLENTFGLHKGQMPTTNRRLVFQAQYSLFPIGIYEYSPSPRTPEHRQLDAYVNRLYLG